MTTAFGLSSAEAAERLVRLGPSAVPPPPRTHGRSLACPHSPVARVAMVTTQSMVFFTLATMQFGIALGVRARPGTLRNPFLLVAVATSFLLQLASLYLPALRHLLDTHARLAAA